MSRRNFFTVEPADGPVVEPISKMGGQPVWLEQPQWPISRNHGTPMSFIAQIKLPAGLIYVFMTDATEYVDDAWEADGGENAVIIQPDGRLPLLGVYGSIVEVYGSDDPRPIDVSAQATGPTVAADHLLVAVPDDPDSYQFTNGEPLWLQNPEVPGEGYGLLLQWESERLPFPINFGDAGIGYVFLSPDLREGRFLWQNS
ncbi:DUF1963 domain-containing protein [Amorphoplanes digitatis]|uniref:Uncharacterized protein n=2 Tax=Actinoplanes digitatis TaxID=1868 RepID=A0A7W7MUE7_9ACTN|nr:DUF1963 domain-containing protein [Actinoplanes digitatis]MBB4766685.1 hypothetical protein [Actinoplanes digitatis]GID96187.1 hypothetical protein Adi01nite_55990 [Actinoplanes digitatis]